MFGAAADNTLIEKALRGHADAWDRLIARHERKVFNFALRMTGNREDALDLMQEVFMAVYRNLPQFNRQAAFSTWLFRIAANRAADFFRRRKPVELLEPGAEIREREDLQASPFDRAARRQTNQRLMAMLRQLSPDQRLAVEMKFFHDMTFEEMAHALDTPANTLKTRLYAALRKLKTLPEAVHA